MAKQKQDSSYNALIAKADILFNDKKWIEAEHVYHDALAIKPIESYPQDQIKLIENNLNNEQQQSIRSQYDALIKNADDKFTEKSYQEALDFYDQANEILPNEPYPLDRIREVKRILSDAEEKENNYNVLIIQADNQYESEAWEKALTTYQAAQAIFDRDYPRNRIEEINSKLSELRDAESKNAQDRVTFDNLIKEGDRLFSDKKYQEAKDKFQEAQQLFEDEYYPKKEDF